VSQVEKVDARWIDRAAAFWYASALQSGKRTDRRGRNPARRSFLPFTAGGQALVQIFVRDNNVDQALKALKKKMQREGTFREMKRRNHYEKPSEKRAREQAEAVRRARKLARKRAQREGLLPKK
jgi:small subunit ribosomal protein S21